MTDKEIVTAAEMWRDGASVHWIARCLCCSTCTIYSAACDNRELFPYRKTFVSEEEKASAVESVLNGKYRMAQVARMLGVHRSAVSKWVKKAREERWKTT